MFFLWHWLASHPWEIVGYTGTVMFGSRFIIQWYKSEIVGRSVIPVAFWYLSLVGGTVSLAYALHIQSGPFIAGQAGGLLIYARNLFLVHRDRRESAA